MPTPMTGKAWVIEGGHGWGSGRGYPFLSVGVRGKAPEALRFSIFYNEIQS